MSFTSTAPRRGGRWTWSAETAGPGSSWTPATGFRGAEAACGYTAAFQSVIGEGPIRVVETAEERRRGLAAIMHQATCCGDWTFPDAAVDAVCVLRLDAEELSCKEHL